MNKFMKAALMLLIPISMMFTSGCGIKKMIKNAGTITYEAKPNPMELHGDSVRVTVTGNFPSNTLTRKRR